MSENYEGNDFSYSYCYDLRKDEEIKFNASHALTLKNIKKIISSDSNPSELQKAYSWFYDFFLVKSTSTQDSQVFVTIYTNAKNILGISKENFDSKRTEFLQMVVDTAMGNDSFRICKKSDIIEMFNMYSDTIK